MTSNEFTLIMAFAEATIGKAIPRTQAEAYFAMLGDLPAEALKIAVQRAFLESSYPTLPSVGTLRKLAKESQRGKRNLSAGEAWGDVMRRMEVARRQATANGCVNTTKAFDGCDPLVYQAAGAFGWASLYHCVQANQDTPRAQFMRIYEAIVADRERQALLPAALREEMKQLASRPKEKLNNRVAGLLDNIGKKP
jgi:hypothetical protein